MTDVALGKFRTDLLESLEKDSKPLTEIAVNFRNQHKGIKIISFFEGDATPPFEDPVSVPLITTLLRTN
jgi:hypothetical protein